LKHGSVAYTVFMLSNSVTPVIFLLAPQIGFEYGVWGIIAFTLAGMISFPFFSLVSKRIQMAAIRPSFKMFAQFIFVTQSLAGLLFVAKILWARSIMNNDLVLLLTIIAVVFTAEFALWKRQHYKMVTVSVVVLGMIAAFLIPTLVYLNVSIPAVYTGLHFVSHESLRLDITDGWMLIFIFILLVFHYPCCFLHGGEIPWKEVKSPVSFALPALMWSFLPISLGSLAFVAKANALRFDYVDHVGLLIIEMFGGQFGKMLFFISILAMLLFALLRLHDQNKSVTRWKWIWVSASIIPIAIVLWTDLTIFHVFLWFGLIQGAMIPVLLMGSREMGNEWIPFLLALSAAIGVAIKINLESAILFGAVVSAMAVIILSSRNHKRKKEKGDQQQEAGLLQEKEEFR